VFVIADLLINRIIPPFPINQEFVFISAARDYNGLAPDAVGILLHGMSLAAPFIEISHQYDFTGLWGVQGKIQSTFFINNSWHIIILLLKAKG